MAEETETPVQSDLNGVEGPGVSHKKIKAIDRAARDYETKKDTRVAASREEVAAKTKLRGLLHQHEEEIGKDGDGIIRYRYDDKVVILAPKDETLKIADADTLDASAE